MSGIHMHHTNGKKAVRPSDCPTRLEILFPHLVN